MVIQINISMEWQFFPSGYNNTTRNFGLYKKSFRVEGSSNSLEAPLIWTVEAIKNVLELVVYLREVVCTKIMLPILIICLFFHRHDTKGEICYFFTNCLWLLTKSQVSWTPGIYWINRRRTWKRYHEAIHGRIYQYR